MSEEIVVIIFLFFCVYYFDYIFQVFLTRHSNRFDREFVKGYILTFKRLHLPYIFGPGSTSPVPRSERRLILIGVFIL